MHPNIAVLLVAIHGAGRQSWRRSGDRRVDKVVHPNIAVLPVLIHGAGRPQATLARSLRRAQIRPLKIYFVLNALIKCAAQAYPAHPPYGGACESTHSLRHRVYIDCLLTFTRFVKEKRRKIFGLCTIKFSRP